MSQANVVTPQTVQTVQADEDRPPTRPVSFEIAKDDNGEWNWILYSGNGRPIATNVRPYPRQNDCTAAVKVVKEMFKGGPEVKLIIPELSE